MSRQRIAESLLAGFIADPALEEAILGDLVEELNERADGPGPGPGPDDGDGYRAWCWGQVLRSAPHLLRGWWRGQGPGRAVRTVARVAAVLVVSASAAAVTFAWLRPGSGGPLGGSGGSDPHAVVAGLLLAGAAWAAAGGLFLAWRTARAPMCQVTLLGLAWFPAVLLPAPLLTSALLPSALFSPAGPPAWLLLALPVLLAAFTVAGGGFAVVLRGARRRDDAPLDETDPTTLEEPVEKAKTVFRAAVRPVLAAMVLLTVPLVAMQFSGEMNWTAFDFVFAGVLVFGTGFALELAAMKRDSGAYRLAAALALAGGFLLVWVTGAVGIIGAEDNPANLMYFGVLAVGIAGAFVARGRPRGMARAMVASAVAQGLVALIAIAYGLGRPYSGAVELAALNGFWIVLFLLSARLFRNAAQARPGAGANAGAGAGG